MFEGWFRTADCEKRFFVNRELEASTSISRVYYFLCFLCFSSFSVIDTRVQASHIPLGPWCEGVDLSGLLSRDVADKEMNG